MPIGAVSCYPASMVKNPVRWCQIFEVLQLQPQKPAKRSNLRICGDSWSFTCSSKTVHYHTELARCWVFGRGNDDNNRYYLLHACLLFTEHSAGSAWHVVCWWLP